MLARMLYLCMIIQTMMRRMVLWLVAAMTVMVGCGGRGDGGGDESASGDSIVRIAYVASLAALPYFVAEDEDLFGEEGLSVELVPFAADMDIDTALVGGSVDGAFTDLFRVKQLERKEGLQLDIITTTAACWALVSNKAARLKRLEQMGDKMVAMTRFSATDYLTDRAFEGVKTQAPYFKVQINDVELRLRMLQNNEMNAAWLPEPYATRARLMGHRVVVDENKYKERYGVLAVRTDAGQKKGYEDLEERLGRVYAATADSVDKRGLAAFAAVVERYCDVDTAVVNRLPAMTFGGGRPTDALMTTAETFLNDE